MISKTIGFRGVPYFQTDPHDLPSFLGDLASCIFLGTLVAKSPTMEETSSIFALVSCFIFVAIPLAISPNTDDNIDDNIDDNRDDIIDDIIDDNIDDNRDDKI